MNINMYVINAILILMVVRQVREHPLDLRSLAVPVLAVGCAAVLFLHSVPAGGNDVVLELTCVLVGAVMGAVGGLATRLRLGADGRPLAARLAACGSGPLTRGWLLRAPATCTRGAACGLSGFSPARVRFRAPRRMPDVLEIGVRGRRHPRAEAYWDGCYFAM